MVYVDGIAACEVLSAASGRLPVTSGITFITTWTSLEGCGSTSSTKVNTGDRFDYFRFDKSSGLIASEAPLRLVWRVRTVGALARQSRAKDPVSAFRPVCARVLALSLCSSMKFERSVSSFTVLAYAQDI